MKYFWFSCAIILVLLYIAVSHAMAQQSINTQPVIPTFPDHPQTASTDYTHTERSLLPGGTIGVAAGERASNFNTPPAIPLGTVARENRKQIRPKSTRPVYTN